MPGAVFTYTMFQLLLLIAGLLPLAIGGVLRAAVHPDAVAGHTISVFAAIVMLPGTSALKRVVNERSASAGGALASTNKATRPPTN